MISLLLNPYVAGGAVAAILAALLWFKLHVKRKATEAVNRDRAERNKTVRAKEKKVNKTTLKATDGTKIESKLRGGKFGK